MFFIITRYGNFLWKLLCSSCMCVCRYLHGKVWLFHESSQNTDSSGESFESWKPTCLKNQRFSVYLILDVNNIKKIKFECSWLIILTILSLPSMLVKKKPYKKYHFLLVKIFSFTYFKFWFQHSFQNTHFLLSQPCVEKNEVRFLKSFWVIELLIN